MKTTTADKPRRSIVLAISIALQISLVAAVWLFARSSMTVDPQEIEKRAVEVQKRERERVEEEREKREKTAVREEDAEKLRKQAREKEEKKVADRVREMRELQHRVREERDRSLEELSSRSLDQLNSTVLNDLVHLARRADGAAFHLSAQSPLPLAKATKPACAQLVTSTEVAMKEGAAKGWEIVSSQLRSEASEIFEPLEERHQEVKADIEDGDGPSQPYGNFVLHSHFTLEQLRAYLAVLEEQILTEEDIAELNDLSGVEFPDKPFPQDQPELDAMSLDELVEEASSLEEAITEDFQEQRAAEIAMIEGSSFQEAMDKVASAVAESSGSQDQQDSSSPNSQEENSSQGESPNQSESGASPPPGGEQQTADASGSNKSEQGAQSQSGKNQEGESSSSSPSGSPSPTTIGDLQNYRSAQASKGRQAKQHWTRAMNMASQAGALGSRKQAGRSAQTFSQNSQQGQANKPGNGGEGGSDGGSKSSRNKDGTASSFRSDTDSPQQARASRVQIPADMVRARALPGRRFSKSSKRQGWLFLDTWYVIGPWENSGKLEYSNVHPPEVGVDLDARYSDGKFLPDSQTKRHPLQWKFVQSDIMRITPPAERGNSTFYAYTEVFFEEATEMLVAIATDDAARMWVNDKVVWEDQGLSGWSFDEGFRKIRFKQGFNTFLVRIENGPGLCEYSVLLCPTQP